MSTITRPVSANIPPRPGQYETVDDIPATTDTAPVSPETLPQPRQYETSDDMPAATTVSARALPQPRQFETIDDIPATTSVSATLPPETAQYETIQDLHFQFSTGRWTIECLPGPGTSWPVVILDRVDISAMALVNIGKTWEILE